MTEKRNLRLYFIRRDDALLFLNWARNSPEMIAVPSMPQSLPPDCEVVDIRENYERRGLDALVYHPSFPEVPDGEMIPREPGVTELVARRVRLPNERVGL